MITVKYQDKIIPTGYYKSPTVHNIIDNGNIVISIRKANVENIDKNVDQSTILNEIVAASHEIYPIKSNYPLEDKI